MLSTVLGIGNRAMTKHKWKNSALLELTFQEGRQKLNSKIQMAECCGERGMGRGLRELGF